MASRRLLAPDFELLQHLGGCAGSTCSDVERCRCERRARCECEGRQSLVPWTLSSHVSLAGGQLTELIADGHGLWTTCAEAWA